MSSVGQPQSGGTPGTIGSQDSPSISRMTHLKQLVLGGDDGPITSQQSQPMEAEDEVSLEMLASGVPDSKLGQAVRHLHDAWTQLVELLMIRNGSHPPSLEHIKEVAEFSIRQLKDSSNDLSREFARVGLGWRLTHPEDAMNEDLADLEQALIRQETLQGRVSGVVQRQLADFANESSAPGE